MKRTIKWLVIAIGGVVAIVVIGAAIAILTVSPTAYKGIILAQLQTATGRDVTIAGPLSLSLFPEIGISATKVSLAGAPGGTETEMVQVKRLDFAVAILPLISGQLKIDRFILVDPAIHLVIDAKGRPNWNFGAAPSATEAPAAGTAQPAASALAALARFRVGEMRVENGDITFTDRRTGTQAELRKVDLAMALPALDRPATFSGTVQWRGTPVAVSATLADPGAIMNPGGKSALSLSLTAKQISAKLTGTLRGTSTTASPLVFDGTATIKMPSARDFIAWSGLKISLPKHGFGPLSVSGKIHDADGIAQFSDADFKLDALRATGKMTIAMTGPRLAATATLAAGTLDLNPYLGPAAASSAQSGWSSAPFDLAPLRQIDLDLALTATALRYRRLTIGKSDIALHLKNSRLVIDIKSLALYRGNVKGQVQLDAVTPNARLTAAVSATGVALKPFLHDFADIDAINGTGSGDLSATATGNSERALVQTLDGKGAFRIDHGRLGGVNLGGMLHNGLDAFHGGGSTAISAASGHFTIRRGIIRNSDLEASMSGIDASGAGTIDLPNRTLDYRVTPRLVAGIVTVPVTVSGPWNDLSYRPDLAGIAKGLVETPGRAVEGAAGLGTNLGKGIGKGIGSGIGNALKGLLGH
ncbi:MAG: AsmA family protein [Stellaceae bacterium]